MNGPITAEGLTRQIGRATDTSCSGRIERRGFDVQFCDGDLLLHRISCPVMNLQRHLLAGQVYSPGARDLSNHARAISRLQLFEYLNCPLFRAVVAEAL